MELIKLLRARQALISVFSEKMSTRLAYKITKFNQAAEVELAFYNQRKDEITQKYGEKDENGKVKRDGDGYIIKDDDIAICISDFKELENTDVEVPNICFTIDELDELKLSPSSINALLPFIKEE